MLARLFRKHCHEGSGPPNDGVHVNPLMKALTMVRFTDIEYARRELDTFNWG
jgi:hypothetical protein